MSSAADAPGSPASGASPASGVSLGWAESPLQAVCIAEAHVAGRLGARTELHLRADVPGMQEFHRRFAALDLPAGLTLAALAPAGAVALPDWQSADCFVCGDPFSGAFQRALHRRAPRRLLIVDDGAATKRFFSLLSRHIPSALVRAKTSPGPARLALGVRTWLTLRSLARRGRLALFTAFSPAADEAARLQAAGVQLQENSFAWTAGQPAQEISTDTVIIGSALAADGLIRADAYRDWVCEQAAAGPVRYFPHRRETSAFLDELRAAGVQVAETGLPVEISLLGLRAGQRILSLPTTAITTLTLLHERTGARILPRTVPAWWWTSNASADFRAEINALVPPPSTEPAAVQADQPAHSVQADQPSSQPPAAHDRTPDQPSTEHDHTADQPAGAVRPAGASKPAGASQPDGLHVVGIADSESYLKWVAATLAQLPQARTRSLWLLDTPLLPSPEQIHAAVGPEVAITVVPIRRLAQMLAAARADALILGATGPTVLQASLIAHRLPARPALLSGLPGVALPPTSKALRYRCLIDAFIVHSHVEQRRWQELAESRGTSLETALARLPFLSGREPAMPEAPVTRIVFAAQAKVPAAHAERAALIATLAAVQHAGTEVIIKLRGWPGENQTHHEEFSFVQLRDELAAAGLPGAAELALRTGPMRDFLTPGTLLATVSSTAALEAIDTGAPVLIIDDFGVSDELLNAAFTDSGLLGPLDELLTTPIPVRRAQPDWLQANYFHTEPDALTAAVDRLALRARARSLPPAGGRLAGARLLLARAELRSRVPEPGVRLVRRARSLRSRLRRR